MRRGEGTRRSRKKEQRGAEEVAKRRFNFLRRKMQQRNKEMGSKGSPIPSSPRRGALPPVENEKLVRYRKIKAKNRAKNKSARKARRVTRARQH